MSSSEPTLIGSVIGGRYVLQRLIGKGGYGCVFEALHLGTEQTVAVKMLTGGRGADDVAVRRFFQEARITAGLRHPNTVRVFDFGQDDSGVPYLTMELLIGRSLKQELRARLKRGQVFTEKEAVEIGIAVTRSLGEAHVAGLVHRDLKPDNVFLHCVDGDDAASVKVLDFGVVKLTDSTLTMGSDTGVPGTPAYMSPEHALKEDVDGRSDLYSLGVVLYSLVTGTVPFRGDNALGTLYKQVHEKVPDLRTRTRTPLTDGFVEVVHRALEKNPRDRHADAQAMRDALQLCLARTSLPPAELIATPHGEWMPAGRARGAHDRTLDDPGLAGQLQPAPATAVDPRPTPALLRGPGDLGALDDIVSVTGDHPSGPVLVSALSHEIDSVRRIRRSAIVMAAVGLVAGSFAAAILWKASKGEFRVEPVVIPVQTQAQLQASEAAPIHTPPVVLDAVEVGPEAADEAKAFEAGASGRANAGGSRADEAADEDGARDRAFEPRDTVTGEDPGATRTDEHARPPSPAARPAAKRKKQQLGAPPKNILELKVW